jgi:transcriptional regulator of acetoin/glycerol metabolism
MDRRSSRNECNWNRTEKQETSVQVLFTEHYCTGWHDWYCAAAPIMNPFTKELLGVFDISGKNSIINSHTIGLAISISNHISKYIEQNVYQYGLQLNPFLNATLDSTEEGVTIADVKKNILKMNVKMEKYLKNMDTKSLTHLGELDGLVSLVIEGEENFLEQEIQLDKDDHRCICSVNPIIMDQELLGVVIRLRESTFNSKLMNTSANINRLSSAKYNFGQ